jgi:hypothetical protein
MGGPWAFSFKLVANNCMCIADFNLVIDMLFFMIVRSVYVRLSSRISSLIAYYRVLNGINTRFADASEQVRRFIRNKYDMVLSFL